MVKFTSLDQETIKINNKKRILNLLRKKRELTKQDISKELGISIPTAISNINELLEEGIVEEAGVAGSTGGRKPVIVKFNPNSRYSFGVDIKPESARIILVNLDSHIIEEKVLKEDFRCDFFKSLKMIEEEIKNIIKEKGIEEKNVLGIGFSLPGTVNEEKLILESAPNLKVKNVSFKEFEESIGISVYIENEANSAALGELSLGITKEMKNLVYISITEGIGVGVVIQDNLYKGKNKRAGEVGHMTIFPGGRKCNCGRQGCLEMYASNKALLKEYEEEKGEAISSLNEFFQRLNNGEMEAKKVWDKYLNYLSIGIQNIILIFDPHYVILGGELGSYRENIIDELSEKVFVENIFYHSDDNKIALSKLDGHASIQGAALLPFYKLFFLGNKII